MRQNVNNLCMKTPCGGGVILYMLLKQICVLSVGNDDVDYKK